MAARQDASGRMPVRRGVLGRGRPSAGRRRQARADRRDRWRAEDGSSAITTVFGVAIFLGFLLLATQVLLHLYATSTVSAAAFDVARRAAAEDAGCADATQRARQLLGTYGRRPGVTVTCEADGERTRVTIAGPTPARLLPSLGDGIAPGGVERSAQVRTERFRRAPVAADPAA